MNFQLRYSIIFYFLIILFLYFYKPKLFILNNGDKSRKLLYLISLIMIIAIISFYIKIMFEWFL